MLIAALVTSRSVHPFLSYWKGLKAVGGGGEGPPTSWLSVFGVLLRAVPLHKPPVSALFPHFSMCPTSSEGWSDSWDLAEGKLTVHPPPLLMKASRLPMAPAEKEVPVGLWYSSGGLWGSGGGDPQKPCLDWQSERRHTICERFLSHTACVFKESVHLFLRLPHTHIPSKWICSCKGEGDKLAAACFMGEISLKLKALF